MTLKFGQVLEDRIQHRFPLLDVWFTNSGGGVMVLTVSAHENQITIGNANDVLGWSDDEGDGADWPSATTQLTATSWIGSNLDYAVALVSNLIRWRFAHVSVPVPGNMCVTLDTAGIVESMRFSPLEGDAGYFGSRQTERFWDAVSRHLTSISTEADDGTVLYPVEWEG